MSVTLPNPGMNFVPLEVLTAENQNKIVENVEFLASKIQDSTNAYVTSRLAIYIDGTNGNDNNSGTTAQTAKKTLQSALDLLNTLGGSIDFKFVTAGNYTAHGGYFDAVNLLFEKNSTSVGTVTINFSSQANIENSVIDLRTVNLEGANIEMYNSQLRTTRAILGSSITLYGTQSQISECTLKQPLSLSNGAAANLNACTIAPEFSTGIPVKIGSSSSVTISNSLIVNEPTTAGLQMLFSVTGGHLIFSSNPTITNNVSANKFARPLAMASAFVVMRDSTKAILDAMATGTNYQSDSLIIKGNATVGS